MSTTAPYTIFKPEYFADSNQSRAWQNLQHEIYRSTGTYTKAFFSRSPGEGTLLAEIRDVAGTQRLVTVTLRPFRGEIVVDVYGAKHIEATATFEGWEHPAVFQAVVNFITRSAER